MESRARENRARRWASRLGYSLRKDRSHNWSLDHYGGYMVVESDTGLPVAGHKYDFKLEAVEDFLGQEEQRLREAAGA